MTKVGRRGGFLAAGLIAAAVGVAAVGTWRADAADQPSGPVPVGPLPAASFANPQDAIVARKDTMKTDGKIFKAMKATVEAGAPVRPFAEDAQWFVDWGKQIPAMFPPGSETGHDTKAKPKIWTDKPGFDRFAGDMVAAAQKLVVAAKADDKAAFGDAFHALGKACGGCHKAYAYPLH
jgi:cytochrome c556